MALTFRGARASLGGAGRSAADILDDEDSTFANVLRFLGRPGFALRALLAGNFSGALRNVGQFALDLPTAGFISRDLSLARLGNIFDPEFAPGSDITTKEDRPEFTDLLRSHGLIGDPARLGFGTRLALDVAGGVFTDPLTYFMGPLKTLGAGAIVGARPGKAAADVAAALKTTPAGRAALAKEVLRPFQKSVIKVDESLRRLNKTIATGADQHAVQKAVRQRDSINNSPVLGRIREIVEDPTKFKANAFEGVLNNPYEAIRRSEAQAAERIFFRGKKVMDASTGAAAQAFSQTLRHSDLSAGLQDLVAEGLTRTTQAVWRIPGTKLSMPLLPGTNLGENFWSKVGRYGTAPGLMRGALKRFGGERGEAIVSTVDDAVKDSMNDFYAKFFDKFRKFSHLLPDTYLDKVKDLHNIEAGLLAGKNIDIERMGKVFSEEESKHIFKPWKETERRFADEVAKAKADAVASGRSFDPAKDMPKWGPARLLEEKNQIVRESAESLGYMPPGPTATLPLPVAPRVSGGTAGYPATARTLTVYRGERVAPLAIADMGRVQNVTGTNPFAMVQSFTDPAVAAGSLRSALRRLESVRTIRTPRVAKLIGNLRKWDTVAQKNPDAWGRALKETLQGNKALLRNYADALWATESGDLARAYAERVRNHLRSGFADIILGTTGPATYKMTGEFKGVLDLSGFKRGHIEPSQARKLLRDLDFEPDQVTRILENMTFESTTRTGVRALAVHTLMRGGTSQEVKEHLLSKGYDAVLHFQYDTASKNIAALDRTKLKSVEAIHGAEQGKKYGAPWAAGRATGGSASAIPSPRGRGPRGRGQPSRETWITGPPTPEARAVALRRRMAARGFPTHTRLRPLGTWTASPAGAARPRFSATDPDYWRKADLGTFSEPPVKGVHSAAVLIEETDGRIWLAEPARFFGGRQATFPGGQLETGLNLRQTAVKEALEETGLHVKLTGFVKDIVDSNTGSVRRIYRARRVGGDPTAAKFEPKLGHAESSRVHLVSSTDAASILNKADDFSVLRHLTPLPPPAPPAPLAQHAKKYAELEALVSMAMSDFGKMPRDLVKVGRWADAHTANPFYIPQQLGAAFSELQDAAIGKPHIEDDLRQLFKKKRLSDVFTGIRTHKDQADFLEKAAKLAKKHNINLDGLVGDEALQNMDFVKLWADRTRAHYRTMTRQGMVNEAKYFLREGSEFQSKEAIFNKYINYQLKGLEQPKGWLTRVVGGGTFKIPLISGHKPGLAKLVKDMGLDSKIVKTAGEPDAFQFKWPGLNYFWKPLLTSAAIPFGRGWNRSFPMHPAFFTRNILGAFTMASHSPEMQGGAKGLVGNMRALLDAVHDVFIVKTLGAKGWSPNHIADFITAIDGNADDVGKALADLKASGKTFGNYSTTEVVQQLRQLLGARFGVSGEKIRLGHDVGELAEGMASLDRYGREVTRNGPKVKIAFNRIVQHGMNTAEFSERRFRIQAYLTALDNGVSPKRAMQMVNDAFVDYSVNSEVEHFLRTYIPFAKWSLGASKWIKTAANRPILVNWMGRARGSPEEGEFLPERAEDSLALPLPWLDLEGNKQFLIGIGLPLETTVNLLSLPTPQGFRRLALGGMQPAIQLPLKAITNRNFFFGDEFGRFRKAPIWAKSIPGLTTEVPVGDGRVRHEINGTFNEVIKALPSSRLEGMFDKWFDDRRGAWNKAINLLTGLRTVSVDVEQEFRLRMMDYLKDKARSGQVGETLIYFDRFKVEDMPEDLKIILQSMKSLKKKRRQRQKEQQKQRPTLLRGSQ